MKKQSGLEQTRPQLKACLNYLKEGDTLVITRLDRLVLSAIHLGTLLDFFQKGLIDLLVLDQQIDTPQPMGKLMFHMLAGFAEFECSIRKERQAEGIEKAIRKGGSLGRPLKLTPAVIRQIKTQRAQSMTIKASKSFHQLGKTTLYRALAASR